MDFSSETLQVVIALAAGISLSASCGFRVFVPPLIVSLAALAGMVDLSPDLAWLGTWRAVLQRLPRRVWQTPCFQQANLPLRRV